MQVQFDYASDNSPWATPCATWVPSEVPYMSILLQNGYINSFRILKCPTMDVNGDGAGKSGTDYCNQCYAMAAYYKNFPLQHYRWSTWSGDSVIPLLILPRPEEQPVIVDSVITPAGSVPADVGREWRRLSPPAAATHMRHFKRAMIGYADGHSEGTSASRAQELHAPISEIWINDDLNNRHH